MFAFFFFTIFDFIPGLSSCVRVCVCACVRVLIVFESNSLNLYQWMDIRLYSMAILIYTLVYMDIIKFNWIFFILFLNVFVLLQWIVFGSN